MNQIWELPAGLLGFPDLTRAAVSALDDEGPYALLQVSANDPTTTLPAAEFVIAQPGAFFDNYVVDVPSAVVDLLDLTDPAHAEVWVIVTQHADRYTVNLRGPLVVNTRTARCAQAVLDDTMPTRAELPAPRTQIAGLPC